MDLIHSLDYLYQHKDFGAGFRFYRDFEKQLALAAYCKWTLLFSNSTNGAASSAALYGNIQTTIVNDAKSFLYFKHVFE